MFRVIYFVSDPQRTSKFYQRAFGARRLRPPEAQDYPPEEWVQVQAGAVQIGFHRLAGLHAKKEHQPSAFKLVFKVADVARKRRALQRQGVEMGKIWKLKPAGSICDGRDPEGHTFQIADR